MTTKRLSAWHWLALIGAILIVSGTIFYLFIPNLFSKGMMYGGDEAAHMFIPKYIVDYFKIHHHLPVINPYWYNGTETLHHIPWLDYIPIAIIYLITKDIYLTNRIFTLLLLLAAGMSMFFFLYKRNNIRSAIIGATIFPFIPIIYFTARMSVTRVTPIILMPLAFYFSDEILEKKFSAHNFIILAVIFAAMIFSHPINGLGALIFLTIYILVRFLSDKGIPFKKFSIWLLAFVAACGLIAFYAIPFLLEPITYHYPGDIAKMDLGRVTNQALVDIAGPLLAGLAIFSFFKTRNRKKWALLVPGILSFLCVTVFAVPFFKLLPWASYSILSLTMISILYWATTAFEFPTLNPKIRLPIALLAVPLIIIVSLFYFNDMVKISNTIGKSFTRSWTLDFENIYPQLDTLKNIPNAGRVYSIKVSAGEDWVVTALAHKYYSEGHYFSITRLSKEIAWINDASDNGYFDYVIAKMNLFNDRIYIDSSDLRNFYKSNPSQGPTFYELLEKDGYKNISSQKDNPNMAIYYKDKPSAYLIPLDEKTLIIGQHAYNYAAFQPNSYIAGSIYLDDYDLDFLKNFDNLVLYGFGYHDKNKAEKLVSDYAKSGGRVTIDMLNVQNSKLEAEDVFLGVQSTPEKTETSLNLEIAQNLQNNLLPQKLELPSEKDFSDANLQPAKPVPLKEWRFTEYLNLDGSIARWQNRPDDDRNLYSLVGYKNIDGNKIWFVGGNLIYHAYLTHNKQEQDFIRQLTTQNPSEISSASSELEITSQNLDPEAGKMEFTYTAGETAPLLVSYTISPHWKAYLNGQPIKIYNLDSMMALTLPAGNNHVTLKYENLPDHWLANGITLLTLVILIYIFYLSRKRGKESV